MGQHIPNSFSTAARLTATIIAVTFAAYAIADLGIGKIYMPAKHGPGFVLSGIPALGIACAAILLCTSASLVVIDHYDRRANETFYTRARATCAKGALVLFLGAPFLEFIHDVFPHADYIGFAAGYSVDTRRWAPWAETISYLNKILLLPLGIVTAASGLGAFLSKRLSDRQGHFWTLMLASLFLLGLFAFGLLKEAEALAYGKTTIGHGSRARTFTAENQPAEFNAVILGKGCAFGIIGLMGIAGLSSLVTQRGRRTEA